MTEKFRECKQCRKCGEEADFYKGGFFYCSFCGETEAIKPQFKYLETLGKGIKNK